MVTYSIVIPTLNERDNIVELLGQIGHCGLSNYEIIVADENSPDGTADAVNAYAAAGHPEVRAVLSDGDPGLSPSIVKGFETARGEILCCMDGDLQHDVGSLPGVLSEFNGGADFVIGSRYVKGGGFAEKWNPCRILISRTATLMARVMLGIKVADPMSGFFAIRRELFEELRPALTPRGFKIMLELLCLAVNRKGDTVRVVEHGIIFNRRKHGESKLTARVAAEYLQMLLALRRNRQA